MGQNCKANDVDICRKPTPSIPIHEECSNAKGGGKLSIHYTIAPTRERLKLFFAQLFLLITSVFTEQSQKCVKNVTPAMIEQGDLLQSNPMFVPSVMKTHIPLTDDPAQPEEDLLQRYRETN